MNLKNIKIIMYNKISSNLINNSMSNKNQFNNLYNKYFKHNNNKTIILYIIQKIITNLKKKEYYE